MLKFVERISYKYNHIIHEAFFSVMVTEGMYLVTSILTIFVLIQTVSNGFNFESTQRVDETLRPPIV